MRIMGIKFDDDLQEAIICNETISQQKDAQATVVEGYADSYEMGVEVIFVEEEEIFPPYIEDVTLTADMKLTIIFSEEM